MLKIELINWKKYIFVKVENCKTKKNKYNKNAI